VIVEEPTPVARVGGTSGQLRPVSAQSKIKS